MPGDGDAVGVGCDDPVQAGSDDVFARFDLSDDVLPRHFHGDVEVIGVAAPGLDGVEVVGDDAYVVSHVYVWVVQVREE